MNRNSAKPSWKVKFILESLKRIRIGHLTMIDPQGKVIHYKGDQEGPQATVEFKNWTVFDDVLNKGDIALAEAYRDGTIKISDVGQFIFLMCLNEDLITDQFKGKWYGLILYRLKHIFNKNTKTGSRKNISAHYDLGNDFYRLWLDQTMTYSSAIFQTKEDTLQEAQLRKYDRIIEQLRISEQPMDILEVGCGWGGFMTRVMEKTNAKLTGVTISEEQFAYCQELIQKHGWQDRAQILFKDYRDIHGQYDRIVSIEMIEAVGAEYWPTYFGKLNDLLAPEGEVLIQGISIRDELFEAYQKGTDFIQQYIFPGGMLISEEEVGKILSNLKMEYKDKFLFGHSYARTLQEWHKTFEQKLATVRGQGFDEKFVNIWKFYLGYCEGAFLSGRINVGQYHLAKIKNGKAS